MKPEASSQSDLGRKKTELLSDALILMGCLVVLVGLCQWSRIAATLFLGALLIAAGLITGTNPLLTKGKTE
jgi:hypothetical protein